MPDLTEVRQEVLKELQEYSLWAYLHESTIEDALKLCVERLPSHIVSRYERALDELRKVRAKK